MRYAVFGDSIMSSCQGHLAWEFGMRGHTFVNFTFPGSAACDWFDDADNRKNEYDRAVVCFMGNLFTPCTQGRGLNQAEILQADLEHLSDILDFLNKPAIYVNPPALTGQFEEQHNWRRLPHQLAAMKNNRPYHDCANVLRNIFGEYTSWLPCDEWDVANNRCMFGIAGIREADQVHLQPSGQHRYSVRIANVL